MFTQISALVLNETRHTLRFSVSANQDGTVRLKRGSDYVLRPLRSCVVDLYQGNDVPPSLTVVSDVAMLQVVDEAPMLVQLGPLHLVVRGTGLVLAPEGTNVAVISVLDAEEITARVLAEA